MTASRHLPTELHAVADTTSAELGLNAQWRSQTVIEQYTPEHQFVGSLMWLSAKHAQPILKLVPDNAIWRPQTRWAYELIRALVESGTDPTPVSVLAAGRHQPARHALQPHQPPRANQHKDLALYLFDAYSHAIAPAASITTYARDVLDEAYRRAFDTLGRKMQHLAACGADRDHLGEQFAIIRDELADLWRRTEAATPQRPQP